ncbi:isoprenylcysteine carboxyl methyltransferase family protein [Acuticoccus kandeliae]|uniref:isoprenylcysteine carboxyl methyltransferase family protein n=1 Tax=Acuticoccus kandeliae TaxID=2073160 RepID=UPI000D3EDC64|nr:isoprenylcysteine carboxylmethyltransferase family protein [Acuticoccus kandeliae]
MVLYYWLFVAAAILFRVAMLVVSMRHERALKAAGAVEYGARNSIALALAMIAFYLAAIFEGLVLNTPTPDAMSLYGLALYVFGAVVLLLVVREMGRIWTVKIMIAPDHPLVKRGLFRWVRHPNYMLNMLPELVGFALALHATTTLFVGLPLFLIPLVIRIRQEETVMRTAVAGY